MKDHSLLSPFFDGPHFRMQNAIPKSTAAAAMKANVESKTRAIADMTFSSPSLLGLYIDY
jgi:hypothetical protein